MAKSRRPKAGKFSDVEKRFLLTYRESKPIPELAATLNRTEDSVKSFLKRLDSNDLAKRLGGLAESAYEKSEAPPSEHSPAVPAGQVADPRAALKATAAWKQIKQELLPDEAAYFMEQFDDLMSQFREDVLASEKTQIFKLIRLAVMMNRNAREQRDFTAAANDAKKKLRHLQDKQGRGEQLSELEQDLIPVFEARLADISAQLSSLTGDYSKLEDKHQRLLEDLKAVRKQRVDRIETGKVDFLTVLRAIATDDRVRQDSERQIELNRTTYAKEVVRLAKPHRFADGSIHQPLLNSETVGMFPDYVPPLPDQQGGGHA